EREDNDRNREERCPALLPHNGDNTQNGEQNNRRNRDRHLQRCSITQRHHTDVMIETIYFTNIIERCFWTVLNLKRCRLDEQSTRELGCHQLKLPPEEEVGNGEHHGSEQNHYSGL